MIHDRLSACEEYLSRFSSGKFEPDILGYLGNYYYSGGDYTMSKQYYRGLVENYPDLDLAFEANERLKRIDEVATEIQQAELAQAEGKRQAEIEHAKRMSQLEAEQAAARLKQEEERVARQAQEQTEAARLAEEREAQAEKARLVDLRLQNNLRGSWIIDYSYSGKHKQGILAIAVDGESVSGTLNTGLTIDNLQNSCTVAGTRTGTSFRLIRKCQGWKSGQKQVWSGTLNTDASTMQGSFSWKGKSYKFSGRKQ